MPIGVYVSVACSQAVEKRTWAAERRRFLKHLQLANFLQLLSQPGQNKSKGQGIETLFQHPDEEHSMKSDFSIFRPRALLKRGLPILAIIAAGCASASIN